MSKPTDKSVPIFDESLAQRRRSRAAKLTGERVLDARVCQDMAARLADVNRNFKDTFIIGRNDITALAQNTASAQKLGRVTCAQNHGHYQDHSFDLVLNLLNLHGANDVPRGLSEMHRILRPDGLMITALFGGNTLRGLRHALYEAETICYDRVSPRVAPMIELDAAGALLQGAGFALPVIDRDPVNLSYKKLGGLFADLRLMGETNTLVNRDKRPVSQQFFTALEMVYRRDYSADNGRILASFDIVWLTGWSPHDSQQKPLKPGSAKKSLASALGTTEIKP